MLSTTLNMKRPFSDKDAYKD
ncbi:hypothetical protein OOU_Y34scaffold01112g9 [Pyricularia oryzae Y34]|uniref:Uncharacterized protein n=1 Tax=Pyricularia oryzae (strain Y34) TaxID=1143189 RepID=A0AA97PFC4_PYRO3|nr:hypothetical protein OOU_Y34scaffold01112g9 [Pyricularia oryzae Y34]